MKNQNKVTIYIFEKKRPEKCVYVPGVCMCFNVSIRDGQLLKN